MKVNAMPRDDPKFGTCFRQAALDWVDDGVVVAATTTVEVWEVV